MGKCQRVGVSHIELIKEFKKILELLELIKQKVTEVSSVTACKTTHKATVI